MRDNRKVNRYSNVSARDAGEERDLKCGTGDVKKDGYTVVARRSRSAFDTEMSSANLGDDDSMPTLPGWYYD